ncbi:MAG TPA: mechanosensitive ion channel domain-containing protein, partial [Pseudomonadales bacterium]
EKPIRGYSQVAKILAYMVAGIFVISILLNKEPWSLLTGLGAMSAILLLVFKDSILGFIAAVQIASYNMIRRGDWVEMSKYDSDGEVLDISLHTVKVQNWDKTISTIPTQAFINESFKNWRGMEESGGRRIKRAISIDMDSIRFCDDALLEKFSKSEVIGDYIKGKRQEVSAYNAEKGYDPRETINGRRLTNIGTFRAYVEAYLRRHKEINMNMTFMVRQLAPSDKGLPIEIYVFCRDQRWAYYEAIQADIFDHLLSVLPEFDLWVFQSPSARSVLNLGGAVKNT